MIPIYRSALAVFSVLLLAFTTSCASIIKGSRQQVSLRSEPSAAQVDIYKPDGTKIADGVTPYNPILDRGKGFFQSASYRVEVNKEGYRPTSFTITSRLNGWYLGNFIFGGLIGFLIVDPATGAMWTLQPDERTFRLYEELESALPDKGFFIVLKEDIPERFHPHMKRVK